MTKPILMPQIDGDWWTIAGNPDLGAYNSERQQPLDFGLWQAADGTWQLGACIRRTHCGGRGRLLYRWQSDSLTDRNWKAMGIMLEADSNFGETVGGLQAPYVIRNDGQYSMFYGDWVHICLAVSSDGKTFSRQLNNNGLSSLFAEGARTNTRDPMLMLFGDTFYLYYTGVRDGIGAIYCRTSVDLQNWGKSTIVSRGGSGGSGPSDAECAFVMYMPEVESFYLLRWHSDGQTSVFCSTNPLDFGIDDDRYKICTLQAEVARIIHWNQQYFISSVHKDYTGMKLANLSWVAR